MAKGNVYDRITERIIASLEKGVVPWQRPWLLSNSAMNLISGKAYRGINFFSLAIAGENYTSRYWLTFNQCKKRGGRVRKGEKSSLIIHAGFSDRRLKNGKVVVNSKGNPEKKFHMTPYNVFNVEQCDNIEYPKPEENCQPVDTLEVCENIIGSFVDCPTIEHKGDRAYYSTKQDSITMPKRDTFKGSEEYYSTLFHECIHATGAASRLNRTLTGHFGTSDYAREELVAEMGAAMLCGVSGIETKTIDNSAAYVANWLKALKNDSKLIVTAASQAQTAAEYMQGIAATKYDSVSTESDKPVAQTMAA